MKNIINKPRVFLSHAKKDIQFINRLYNNLVKCQIEPWIDTNEIRHGEPWLNAIFENGIPTCDSFIVYLTEYSIESEMVKKEIDAGLIQKLKDGGISFLPYVMENNLRSRLRLDLQSIQIPEWNDSNYYELLPIVVAEIWRSYLERSITNAVSSEKVKSLEYQLQLERIKNQQTSIFNPSEEKDFKYIYDYFNKEMQISLIVHRVIEKAKNSHEDKLVGKKNFNLLLVTIIPFLSSSESIRYYNSDIEKVLLNYFTKKKLFNEQKEFVYKYSIKNYPELSDIFLTFGFISRIFTPKSVLDDKLTRMFQRDSSLQYTEKIEKFKYWLRINELLPDEIKANEIMEILST